MTFKPESIIEYFRNDEKGKGYYLQLNHPAQVQIAILETLVDIKKLLTPDQGVSE